MKKLLVLVCCLLFALPLYAADTAMDSFTDDSASPVGTDYLIGYSGATGYRWTINSLIGLAGDVTGVGDCSTGACLDGSSDGGTYVRLYDGTSAYTGITAGVRTLTLAPSNTNAENMTITFGDNNNAVAIASGTGATVSISGNAATATALASNPTDCAAGEVATGIAANGNLTCTATPSVTTLTGAVSGNASTASALAANGANCDAGSAPRGVDASGAAEDCTAYQASNADLTAIAALNCTENQIIKRNGEGAWACAADETGVGTGDVSDVGDCSGGACLDGSSDGGTYVRLYDGTSAYESITGGVRTFTFASSTADSENVVLTLGNNDNTLTLSSGTGAASLNLNAFTVSANGFVPDAADGAALGSATAEFSDLYLADGGVIYFQNDQSVYLTPSAGTLTLTGAFTSTGAVTATSFSTSASADPIITMTDSSTSATGTGDIYVNATTAGQDSIMKFFVDDSAGEKTEYIEIDGVSETVDMLKPVVLTSTLAFVEAQGNTTITVGDNAGAVALTLPNATGTIAATGTLTNTKWCSTDGTLINCTEDAPAGSGDITAVGSCTTGSCATIGNADTSGGYIDFLEDSDNGTNYVRLKAPDSTADATVTLPSATGTLALNDQTFYIGTTQVAINRGSAALTLAGITLTTPDIGAATGTSLALGADPAETGAIMLANGAAIGWEDATEATITHVNDTGLKFNLPVILSNDESISNVDDTEITFVGTEAISLDLDTGTANQVQWKNRTTSSTGVTDMSFSALNLATTGTIDGGIPVSKVTDATITVSGMTKYYVNADDDTIAFNLPADPTNRAYCFANLLYARAITVNPDDSDYIVNEDATLSAGEAIISSGAKKDQICLVGIDTGYWKVSSKIGTWAEETP